MDNRSYFNTVGSYRLGSIYLFLIETGFADVLLQLTCKATGANICNAMGWNSAYGLRMLDTLVQQKLLNRKQGNYSPTDILIRYFSKKSKYYQGYNILFEHSLHPSWQTLQECLTLGERSYHTKEKTDEQYQKDLESYIRAMDNVAVLRSEELWNTIALPTVGKFLDVASGSCTFSLDLLVKYPGWYANCLDLPDVVKLSKILLYEKVALSIYPKEITQRIAYHSSNLLEDELPSSTWFDCILLSNIIHCYHAESIGKLLTKCLNQLSPGGLLLIHDFFKDTPGGSVYDLHMMLNTFDGKSYTQDEILKLCPASEELMCRDIRLNSGSSCLILQPIR